MADYIVKNTEKVEKMMTEKEELKKEEQKKIHLLLIYERELNRERLSSFREGFENFKKKKEKLRALM